MKIFEAYDLTKTVHSAAQLSGADPKTVKRYVELRQLGLNPYERAARPKLIDPFLEKIEEWVEASKAKIRADIAHDKLIAMGYRGSPRSTRRAVNTAKAAWRAGRRRTYRPWIPEPGMWLQFDWGEGPRVDGRRTWLWCAWLAWSKFRVVIPVWDCTLGTLVSCLDSTLRRIGGAPTYVLTDNAKTVTSDHVAGIAVRHPQIVAAGRYYGCTVETCVPYDPESKGGVEATVRLAKADLVPTEANLRSQYGSFAELADECRTWCEKINARRHRGSGQIPAEQLLIEQQALHVLPAEPFALALGEQRIVYDDQTISFASVRYSTPPGHVDTKVWVRVVGEELVITARAAGGELAEIARHRVSVPGNPQILAEHYPHHPNGRSIHQPKPRPRNEAEVAFLGIGPGAERWLTEAGPAGAVRIRAKMARAVELAAVLGAERVDEALGLAAIAGRFADDDLPAIVDHLSDHRAVGELVRADEKHSAQPGTASWQALGQ
ncbi:IS21 family transposase [Nonomuraea deserti]|uniref:IS21 family transposase n=1 Tax=Nonomuraea deserti TaxID=1848322 RepID=A0A4R4TW46_9ACTN|nr:IS21 family transposase [Nonomuraea deserti]TDC82857.1 IS21 family transposase [Nonomuraea deserti]